MTPEQEAKARQLLDQKEKETGPVASIPSAAPLPRPATSAAEVKAKRELIKQQEREGKKRREEEKKADKIAARQRVEQEAKAKKEMERLDREAKAKARDDARHQLEAEAKSRQVAKVRENGAAKPEQPAGVKPSVEPAPSPSNPVTVSKPAPEPKSSAPAVSGKTKKQRLEALTDSYVRDQVTAEQYHRERAKILAEPGD